MTAPILLWGGMVRLLGDEDLACHLTAMQVAEGSTMWRSVWLTPTRVLLCEASKKTSRWTSTSQEPGDDRADAVELWCQRRRDIVGVELTDLVTQKLEYTDAGREWRSGARIEFGTGKPLMIPLFLGRPNNAADRDRRDLMISELLTLTP